MVSVSGYLIGNPEANKMPSPPKGEADFWYPYYFRDGTRTAGL